MVENSTKIAKLAEIWAFWSKSSFSLNLDPDFFQLLKSVLVEILISYVKFCVDHDARSLGVLAQIYLPIAPHFWMKMTAKEKKKDISFLFSQFSIDSYIGCIYVFPAVFENNSGQIFTFLKKTRHYNMQNSCQNIIFFIIFRKTTSIDTTCSKAYGK